jgi:hypothetical protein
MPVLPIAGLKLALGILGGVWDIFLIYSAINLWTSDAVWGSDWETLL